MRIIAGEFRGRPLLLPGTDATRPITDRVKQSVFDILAPMIPQAIVYDCFSGSGSMGLECLSRGAAHATFFEADRTAAERLRQNVAALRVEDRATLIRGDLFRWFGGARAPSGAGAPVTGTSAPVNSAPSSPAPGESVSRGVSLIFLDPPYRFLRERPDNLRQLAVQMALHHASDGAIMIFRHDAGDQLTLPPFSPADVRDYGGMTVEFLRLDSEAVQSGG